MPRARDTTNTRGRLIPDHRLPDNATPEQVRGHKAVRLHARGHNMLEIAAELGCTERQAVEIVYGESKRRIDLLKLGSKIYGKDRFQFEIDKQI